MARLLGISLVATLALLPACGADEADPPFVTLGREVAGTSTTTPTTTDSSLVSPPPGTVEIVDFRFSPREITISRGETVTWRNEDPYAHWVVSTRPDVLDSGEMSQAQAYSKVFSQAGTYDYYCNIHNYMKATVTVQ